MGLKWFRARLTLNRKSKNLVRHPEFYRSMSQFDSDVQYSVQQASTSEENRGAHGAHSAPASPRSYVYNPMAVPNGQQNESSNSREDGVPKPKPRKIWQAVSDEEPDSPDDTGEILRHLPRESIELMRDGSAENTPRQLVAKTRKADFKKKKGKAPLPNPTTDNGEDGQRPPPVGRGRSSDGSEVEI